KLVRHWCFRGYRDAGLRSRDQIPKEFNNSSRAFGVGVAVAAITQGADLAGPKSKEDTKRTTICPPARRAARVDERAHRGKCERGGAGVGTRCEGAKAVSLPRARRRARPASEVLPS